MAFEQRSMNRKNKKGLALSSTPKESAPSAGDAQIPGALGNDDRQDTLEIGVEFRLDLHSEDLIVLKELGAGNGGTVAKVQHMATKQIMARKIIQVDAKKEVRKRIVRELGIMHECNSPNIVSFYGAFMSDTGDVVMCMEYMDCGSLDSISKNFGPVRVDVLGKIAEAILGGLTYLYTNHRIMHRDIKPSNVLVNSQGKIKLCDFGVSSELENSVADTFVGTGTYMAPERIQGSAYTVKSDVWSVGLTLMELAIGKFPFNMNDEDGEDAPQGILDLLQTIVLEPSPRLPKSDAFPSILEDMIANCLMKDPAQRPTPKELYDHDPFLQAAKRTPVDLEQWAVSLMERHNRKSHLMEELSPATKNALREASTPSSGSTARTTPTSSDMPAMDKLSLEPNGRSTQSAARPFPAPMINNGPLPPRRPTRLGNPLPPQPAPLQPPSRGPDRSRSPHDPMSAPPIGAPRGLRRPGATVGERHSAYSSTPVERSSAASFNNPSMERRSAYNSPVDSSRRQWM